MMELDFTKEELETLEAYVSKKYEAMNQLLVSNCETDIALLSDEVENKVVKIPYDRESVIENLMNTKNLYKLFMKNFYKSKHEEKTFFRGTNLAEVERLKMEPFIDRIWSATTDKKSQEKFAKKWNRPVGITITLEENIPYFNVGNILGSEKYNKDILIAPFTKVKKIEEDKTYAYIDTKDTGYENFFELRYFLSPRKSIHYNIYCDGVNEADIDQIFELLNNLDVDYYIIRNSPKLENYFNCEYDKEKGTVLKKNKNATSLDDLFEKEV